MSSFSVVSDGVVQFGPEDLLQFNRYVDPLVSVLTHANTRTPFTIGIFGEWGSGKSSLLSLLQQKLASEHPKRFVRVEFNPWMHRTEGNMLIPLLHAFHDTLEQDAGARFKDSALKIGDVLVRLGADILLKKLTADAASLEKLEALEKRYQQERGKVESEIRRLRKTLQAEVDAMHQKDGTEVIFFVDDLDRCQPDQIIDLLESVKLFLDLRHVFVVMAMDKEVVDLGIQTKYHSFGFKEVRAAAIGAEYLEKMIHLPLQLYPLHPSQVERYVEKLMPQKAVQDQLPLIRAVVKPNPRKVKRVLNSLAMALAVREGSPALQTLAPERIARLVVLQAQKPDLYAEVILQPELLIALEKVYSGALNTNDLTGFAIFENPTRFRDLCKLYHEPGSFMTPLFKDAKFDDASKQLADYVAMVGA